MSSELQVMKVGEYAKNDIFSKRGISKNLLHGSVFQIRQGMLTLKALEKGSRLSEAMLVHHL